MPVSPPPVPMLSHPPPHLGVGCSFHILVRRDHCPSFTPPCLVSCVPFCLSVCLYSPRSILPHIKPPSCPLRPPPEPASLFPPHGCQPRHVGAANMQGDEKGGCRNKQCPKLFTQQKRWSFLWDSDALHSSLTGAVWPESAPPQPQTSHLTCLPVSRARKNDKMKQGNGVLVLFRG